MKRNKGITLIALVITIVVLLILAGVTLNIIVNPESVFKKAGQAKEETNKGVAKETLEIELANLRGNLLLEKGEALLSDLIGLERNPAITVAKDESENVLVEIFNDE